MKVSKKKKKQAEIKADVMSNKTARKLILKEVSTFLATLMIVSSIVLVVNVTAPKKNTDSDEMAEVTTTYSTTSIPETVTTTNTKKTTRKTTTTATSVTTTTSSTSTTGTVQLPKEVESFIERLIESKVNEMSLDEFDTILKKIDDYTD